MALYDLHDQPSLDSPVLVMVLEGWIDAGFAAGTAVQTLLVMVQREVGERLTRGELRRDVARLAAGLRALGVVPGDRVAAYLPNIPETAVAFLATASLGAVWATCPPEFGVRSVHVPHLQTSLSLWTLNLDSELIFIPPWSPDKMSEDAKFALGF